MTYPTLLKGIYTHYSTLRDEWSSKIDQHENIGAFVFEPEGYSTAESFDQVKYEFWPITSMQEYLEKGEETDDGLIELIRDFDFGEEFLVMIIEHVDGPKKHAVHIHKITRVGLN
jgi:hypothetical protein